MKLNNITLGIIFIALLALLLAKKTLFKPTNSSFKTELTSFEPELIDKVKIRVIDQEPTILKLSNEGWTASNGILTVPAKTDDVEAYINEFSNIKVKQLVSKNDEKWSEYEVDDSKAKIAEFYASGKKVASVHVGRFNFNQQKRSGVSYARNSDDNEIYALDGFISMSAGKSFNSFRDAKLMDVESNDLESVVVTDNFGESVLSKSLDNQWLKNNVKIDSNEVNRYLTGIQNLSGTNFNDVYSAIAEDKIKTIKIGNNTIDAYLNKEGGFVLKSSINPAYFDSDSLGIFKKLFLDFETL